MQITGGRVSFRRVVQPAQYESKEGLVELSFAVAEGEGDKAQAFLDATAQMAQEKALELVGLKPTTAKAPELKVVETPPSEATQKAKDDAKAKAAAKLNAKEKKAEATKGNELDDLPADPKPNISASPEDRKDPDGLDGLDEDVLGPAPKEITDVELRDAVSIWVNKHKNAAAVKDLRSKFAGPPPKGLNDIPQSKRVAFLAELEGLAAKAA